MYEHRSQPLIARRAFVRRVARHALAAGLIVLGSLLAGILGYHLTENLAWIDALLNAAMILGGMGPVAQLTTEGGKVFAGLYALYAGMIFLVAVGILLLPVLHRMLHSFHID